MYAMEGKGDICRHVVIGNDLLLKRSDFLPGFVGKPDVPYAPGNDRGFFRGQELLLSLEMIHHSCF